MRKRKYTVMRFIGMQETSNGRRNEIYRCEACGYLTVRTVYSSSIIVRDAERISSALRKGTEGMNTIIAVRNRELNAKRLEEAWNAATALQDYMYQLKTPEDFVSMRKDMRQILNKITIIKAYVKSARNWMETEQPAGGKQK